MSVINSIFNVGAIVISTATKLALVTARIAVVSAVTTTAAVAATVVDESIKAANQIRDDRTVNAGIEHGKASYAASVTYAKNKAAALESAASAFEARHK